MSVYGVLFILACLILCTHLAAKEAVAKERERRQLHDLFFTPRPKDPHAPPAVGSKEYQDAELARLRRSQHF